jgi:hypothetical protein
MPLPVPDKNIPALYQRLYEGKELEAALAAFALYPTYQGDCYEKKQKKEKLRMDYMNLLLKKAA